MSRTSHVYYIAPSSISLIPNANGRSSDIAVYIEPNATIRVYSPKAGIGTEADGKYREWQFSGPNRRLSKADLPHTIYIRLVRGKSDSGFLLFIPKHEITSGVWEDKYPYVTDYGFCTDTQEQNVNPDYYYIRIGDVSAPVDGQRTLTFDTGILGTQLFNTEWALNPDSLPLRIELGCTVNGEDVGPTPYVYWGQTLVLTALLTEGWTGTDIQRFDHWEIARDSGSSSADNQWNTDHNIDGENTFWRTGAVSLVHGRGSVNTDDFNSAVNTTFVINAMENTGTAESPVYAVLESVSICIMAETWEKYELSLAAQMVTYNPITRSYSPNNGVTFNVRATDQKSNVFLMSNQQVGDAGLVAEYSAIDTDSWTAITISGQASAAAQGTVPQSAFTDNKKSINVRLRYGAGTELFRTTIAFLRDGEDSKEREWIFLRSTDAITFGTQEHPYPAGISAGQVNPSGAATGSDTNKNQDGWVPNGWWDEQQGVDVSNRYEYGAYRDFVHESGSTPAHWGAFTTPKIWNHWGKDGKDVQDVYLRGTARDVDTNVTTTLPAQVMANGSSILSTRSRGLNLVTLNRQTLAEVESINYDTYGEAANAPDKHNNGITLLKEKLNSLDSSVFVCLVSYDAVGWDNELVTLLQGFGMDDLPYTQTGRYPFLLLGYKNLGKGNGYTRMHNVGSYLDVVELGVYVAGGAFAVRDGENAIRLDIDNEYDSIQYQGDGVTKVDPAATVQTTVHLYDGIFEKTESDGAVFSIDTTHTTIGSGNYTLSGRVLTVNRLNISNSKAQDGRVTIQCVYNGVTRKAEFSVKALIGIDKYDLVVTPNAVPVNTSNTVADTAISVQVYRTPSNGGTRHLVQFTNKTTNDYGLTLSVKDSLNNSLTETTGTGEVTTRIFNLTGTMATNADNVMIVLTKDSKTQDSETVPIAHVQNGAPGSGANAVKIDLDNEMDSIPCDSDGKVMSQTVLEVNARIYDGAAPVSSGVTVGSVGAIADVSAVTSVSNGVVNIKWTIPATGSGTPLSVDKYTSQIVLTWGGNSYYATFTANVVKSGEPGVSPVVYNLKPSMTQIAVGRTDIGGYSPATVSLACGYVKSVGSTITTVDDPTAAFDGYNLVYRRHLRGGDWEEYNNEYIYIIYTRDNGSARSMLSSLDVSTYDEVEFYIVPIGATLHYQGQFYFIKTVSGYIDKETVPVISDGMKGADAVGVNPNILLRTVFDKGIDFVKEAWTSNWNVTSVADNMDTVVDGNDTSIDIAVDGRKSLLMDMSAIASGYCDTFQKVKGKLKPSTWYTVSFNYFATAGWETYLHSNIGSKPPYYDVSAGIIIDGVRQAMSTNNGRVAWPDDMTGARHTMTFKTASDLSNIWDNAQLLFRTPHGGQLALCMPKMEEGQVATAYVAHEDDLAGDKGDDAVNVIVSPASMIVEQDINNKDNIAHAADNNLGQFSIQVLKGSTACNITSITASASHVYMSESASAGDYTGNNCRTWTSSVPQVADMYLKGIGKDDNSEYYVTGQISLSITYTDPGTNASKTITNIIAKVYVNLIGSWSETIEGDVKRSVASSMGFTVDPDGVIHWENVGDYIQSSTENISRLTRQVNNGKNLLTGVLTGTGWKSAAQPNGTLHSITMDGYNIVCADGDSYIVSPPITLTEGTDYMLSFFTNSEEDSVSIAIVGRGEPRTLQPPATGDGYFTKSIPALQSTETVRIYIGVSSLYYPQLEEGQVATAFEANTTEVSSEIKQTADGITSTVNGIDGRVSTVEQKADSITSTVKGNGNNLVLNGAFKSAALNWSTWGTPATREIMPIDGKQWMHIESTTSQYEGYQQRHYSDFGVTVVAGKKYTVSLRAYAASGTSDICIGFHWYNGNTRMQDVQTWCTWEIDTNAKVYSAVIEVPAGANNFNIMVGDKTVSQQNIYITEVKLEEGEIPTAWSSNEEDTYSQIKLTADSINAVVNDPEKGIAALNMRADKISLGISTGFRNYIQKPLAVDMTVSKCKINAEDTQNQGASVVNDSLFGDVMQIHNYADGDWQLISGFDDDNRAELTDEVVTVFAVVKFVAYKSGTTTAQCFFGTWSSGSYELPGILKVYNNNGNMSVASSCSSYDNYQSGMESLADGWYKIWVSFNAGEIFSLVKNNTGVNSVNGSTWQVYYFGIVKGTVVPTLESLSFADGLKKTGIDITRNVIQLRAGQVDFVDPNGDPYGEPKVSIDAETGTLTAVDGNFRGKLTVQGLTHTVKQISNNDLNEENTFYLHPASLFDVYFSNLDENIKINLSWLQYGDYIGKELTFINGSTHSIILKGNYFCYATSNNNYYHTGNSISIPHESPPVKVMLVKHTDNSWSWTWYVISGIVREW